MGLVLVRASQMEPDHDKRYATTISLLRIKHLGCYRETEGESGL